MNPYLKLVGSALLKEATPMISGLMKDYFSNRAASKIKEIDTKKFEKMKKMLDSKSKSVSPIMKVGGLTTGFLQGESIEDLGRRKWAEYEDHLRTLPENATTSQVQRKVREIEQNIRIYPCVECRENAIENLEKLPLVDKSVKNKSDALKRLCSFHNVVREMKGQQITIQCENFS